MWQKSIKLVSKVIFSLAFLSFFACVFHVVPQVSHHASDTKESGKVACVDHEVSISGHRDQYSLDFTTIALIPLSGFDFDIIFNNDQTSTIEFDISKSPPDKIALYIKHNILLI